MLKALRATSLVCMVLAVCIIIVMIILGLKQNPKTNDFLQKQSILDTIRHRIKNTKSQGNDVTQLVKQVQLFAERIDPPEIIKQAIPPPENEINERDDTESKSENEDIKVAPPTLKFDLLATVLYESVPEKSLALFQSGNKQEWFRCGDVVDRYRIQEIKDGRVVIVQPDRKLREMHVPQKSPIAPLLQNN